MSIVMRLTSHLHNRCQRSNPVGWVKCLWVRVCVFLHARERLKCPHCSYRGSIGQSEVTWFVIKIDFIVPVGNKLLH